MKIVLGPPGTGKTTRLLEITEQEMQAGVPPDRIAFVAYTKKAASEAVERASIKFGLNREQFPYFRTLHSLAYQMLGQGMGQSVLQTYHVRDAFKDAPGIVVRREMSADQASTMTIGEELHYIHNLARLRCQSPQEFIRTYRARTEITPSLIDYYIRKLEHYKQENGLWDFTDLIGEFVTDGFVPPIDVLIVDEAQALRKLQWPMISKIAPHAKRLYLAGDDDQTIYECFGADVETFLGVSGKVEFLPQSYRCPQVVTGLANRIIDRVRQRRPKEWRAREEQGTLSVVNDEAINFSRGEWLVLARNNYLLNPIRERLKDQGYFYHSNGKPSVDEDRLQAVQDWIALQHGQSIPAGRAVALSQHINKTHVNRTKLGKLRDMFADTPVTMDTLAACGVDTRHSWGATLNWQLAKYQEDNIQTYVSRIVSRRGSTKARIKVSTIHAAKGGEAENVVLYADTSSAVEKNQYKLGTRDTEHRVFYVGVTRAKQNLYVVPPKSNTFYRLPV